MDKPKKRKYCKYDADFKKEVLKMLNSDRSVAEVAITMGIGENLLYKWKADEKSRLSPEVSQQNAELEQLGKQLKQTEMERDIKKSVSHFQPSDLRNIYEVVSHLAQSYPQRSICLILEISFSAYYAWVRKESYTQSTHKQTLAKGVKNVFEEHRSRYGAIRISKELQAGNKN